MSTAIELSKGQEMLLDIASKFFRERWPIDSVREQLTSEAGYDSKIWDEMAELGWQGMVVPERYGGAGLGMIELVALVEPMGRALFGSPFVATQLAIQALRSGGSEEQQARWLPLLAQGAVGTVALLEHDGDWMLDRCACTGTLAGSTIQLSGEKTFVTDAAQAELLLASVQVDGAPALILIEGGELDEGAVERETVIDETRRSYRLQLDGIEVREQALISGDAAKRALDAVFAAGMLLVSAEACGGMAGALALVVEYLTSRRQFGKLIGGYQALKHPTVDILVGLERSRSHLYHAATVFERPEATDALRMAKTEASESFAFAGDRAVQFHGGVGFTYECDAQLYLRRALWCQYQFGDPLHHRRHLAETLL